MNSLKILNANIKNFTQVYADSARFNKDIAMKMVYNHGLEGDVNDVFIRKVLPETFDEVGNLTEKGKASIRSQIMETHSALPIDERLKLASEYSANDYFVDRYMEDFRL